MLCFLLFYLAREEVTDHIEIEQFSEPFDCDVVYFVVGWIWNGGILFYDFSDTCLSWYVK